MRILLIHNYYQYYGGEDTYFDSLANLLQKKGHSIKKYTKSSKKIESSVLNKLKIVKNSYWNKECEYELSEIIRDFKPDLAHINNIYPLITPTVFKICQKNAIPTVHTIHTYRYLCPKGTLFRDGKTCQLCVGKRFYYPSIQYKCYHHSAAASLVMSTSFLYHDIFKQLKSLDMLIFPAKFARDFYVKHLGILEDKTAVLPNFVESKISKKKISKKNYFLYVGRFSEEKGILPLLKLISTLPNIKLTVIGDGPLKKRVLEFTTFKNIKVRIAIPKNQVYEEMRNALCTIIPSTPLYEFGPIVLMESFASETPVLVPKAGVFLERVKEEQTGFFYNPTEPDSFIEKIVYIEKNKEKVKKMSPMVRVEYEENYTEDIHYKKLMELYRKVTE